MEKIYVQNNVLKIQYITFTFSKGLKIIIFHDFDYMNLNEDNIFFIK